MAPMKGVQHLEEDRSRFMFKLAKRWHDFLFDAFKNKLCVVEVIIDFSAELLYRIGIRDVLARDEGSAQL